MVKNATDYRGFVNGPVVSSLGVPRGPVPRSGSLRGGGARSPMEPLVYRFAVDWALDNANDEASTPLASILVEVTTTNRSAAPGGSEGLSPPVASRGNGTHNRDEGPGDGVVTTAQAGGFWRSPCRGGDTGLYPGATRGVATQRAQSVRLVPDATRPATPADVGHP